MHVFAELDFINILMATNYAWLVLEFGVNGSIVNTKVLYSI